MTTKLQYSDIIYYGHRLSIFIILFFQCHVTTLAQTNSGVKAAIDEVDSLLSNNQPTLGLKLADSLWYFVKERNLGQEHALLSKVYGDYYFEEENYNLSRNYYLPLLTKIWKEESNPDFISKMARAINDLGILYYRIGALDSAFIAHDRSIELAESVNDLNILAFNYNNLGILLKERGRNDEAIDSYNKSLRYARQLNDSVGIGYNYINLALLYTDKGQYALSIDHMLKSLQIFKSLGNQSILKIINDRLTGYYIRIDDEETALQYLKTMKRLAIEQDDKRYIARTGLYMARYHDKKNNLDSTLYYYDRAISDFRQLNVQKVLANALNEKAEFLVKVDQYNKAQILYEEVIDISDGSFLGNQMDALAGIAWIYFKQGQYNRAVRFADQGLKIDVAELQSFNAKIRLSQVLYESHKALGNHELALKYLEILRTATDETFNRDKEREIARLEYQYRADQDRAQHILEKEQQQLLHEQQLEKETLIRNSIIIIALLALVLAYVSYRSYKRKITANVLLTKQADQLKDKNDELAKLYEKEKKLLKANLEEKERRLAAITFNQHEREGLLQSISDEISQFSVIESEKTKLKGLQKLIRSNLNVSQSWDSFVHQFDQVHPNFFSTLQGSYPSISINDLKICAYIKIGMDNKNIASVTNASVNTVKSRINRMKKKMELLPEDDLRSLLLSVN